MNLQQVKNSLQYARAQVEKGWCQGMLGNDQGECCAKGALHHGVSQYFSKTGKGYWAAYSVAMDYLLKDVETKLPEGYDPLVEWNDLHGRTQKEVVALFDKAIELVEIDLKPTFFAWMK